MVVVDDLDGGLAAAGWWPSRSGDRSRPDARARRHRPTASLRRHTEVGEQHVDVAEDAEVQRTEAARLGQQQQVLRRHRRVGQPERHRPVGGDLEPVAGLVGLRVARRVGVGIGEREHDHRARAAHRPGSSANHASAPVVCQNLATASPVEHDEVHALAVAGRRRAPGEVEQVGDQLGIERRRR